MKNLLLASGGQSARRTGERLMDATVVFATVTCAVPLNDPARGRYRGRRSG